MVAVGWASSACLPGGRLHNRQTDAFPVVLHSPGLAHFQRVFTQLRDKGLQTDVLDCH